MTHYGNNVCDARPVSPPDEPGPAAGHRVTLITRAGCHLCEQAETTLRALAAELGFGYDERDVDAEPALRAQYSDRVPVVLLDDREHGYWRVEEARLRRALAAPARRRGRPWG